MSSAGFWQGRHEYLPDEQRRALRAAVRWQIFTVLYTAGTIALIALVLGNSQAMKTAWIEDMLSLLPQLSFLIALVFVRKRARQQRPYGWHRAMGVGHLVAGVALLAVGGSLAVESVTGLVAGERPTIGTVNVFGQTVWLGWLMVAVMTVTVIGPLLYGRAKARLAPVLHNKLLWADADMAQADWQTNVASVVGVLGVGLGVWWLDGVAALFISLGVCWDGLRNTRDAVRDLMDQRARSYDGRDPHPLADEILDYLRGIPWVQSSAIRMRDQGQVFHVEVFVQPRTEWISLERLNEVCTGVHELDWKIHDVVIVPTSPLPAYADDGSNAEISVRWPKSQPH